MESPISSGTDHAAVSPEPFSDLATLDNPIWNALGSEHSALSLGNNLARRYPPEIGPLSGIPHRSNANFEALRELAGPGGVVVLFCCEPLSPREGWTPLRACPMDQMIGLESPKAATPALPKDVELRPLTANDVPAMMELTKLTEPGPFRHRTIELGAFFGIFQGGRLLAMAGERLHLPQFVEVSAVCTHPDARGRGYARILISIVMNEIRRRGKIPILHTLADNHSAIRIYHDLGFTLRRTLHLAVLKNDL